MGWGADHRLRACSHDETSDHEMLRPFEQTLAEALTPGKMRNLGVAAKRQAPPWALFDEPQCGRQYLAFWKKTLSVETGNVVYTDKDILVEIEDSHNAMAAEKVKTVVDSVIGTDHLVLGSK